MYKPLILFMALLSIGLPSCTKDGCGCEATACRPALVVGEEGFQNFPNDPHFIALARVEGQCLEVVYRYGGGCGTVSTQLLVNEVAAYTEPPTRFLRLSLEDNDLCEALVSDTLQFDLGVLHSGEEGQALLRLEGWEEVIDYSY